MLSKEKPPGFTSDIEVAGCFVDFEGKFLMLKRASGKHEEGKWGVPGGKIVPGETLEAAIKREVLEETGLAIDTSKLKYIAPVYVEYINFFATYHMFFLDLDTMPTDIKINPAEHTEFAWLEPQTALGMTDLMQDEDACIRLAYGL